jgi:hypothetical protein
MMMNKINYNLVIKAGIESQPGTIKGQGAGVGLNIYRKLRMANMSEF